MLQYDPAQRITAKQAMNHPYLASVAPEERKKEEERKIEMLALEKYRAEMKAKMSKQSGFEKSHLCSELTQYSSFFNKQLKSRRQKNC